MTSPTKDSSIDHHPHHHEGSSPNINNPITGFGSPSSSPEDPKQENDATSTEVQASQTSPLSPTPPFTSSGGFGEITGDHAIDPPPPPSPRLFIPPDTITTSVGSSSGRKRGRPRKEHSGGESLSSTPRNKKLSRGDDNNEQAPIKCVVCGREFCSDKAYFGHLRKHPDRQWRGAYPPPEVKKLGPTLLELANQTIALMSGSTSSYSSSRGSLGINLNNPPPIPPPPPPPPPSPPPRRDDRGALPFDLNMLPPPENDEDEENLEHAHDAHNHSNI